MYSNIFKNNSFSSLFFILCLAVSFLAKAEAKPQLKKVFDTQKQSQKQAIKSQKKINYLDDETQSLVQEYRLTLKNIYNTQKYNDQLRGFIKRQKEEMISLRKQIEEVKDTGKDILPLIDRMLASLEQFIKLDKPFLLEVRMERISDLKKIMKRSDISTSEKYRRLLSVYEIENEYGRTISAYKGLQTIKDRKITVDFLRIGRVSLMYQSLDNKHRAYWDDTKKEWIHLPRAYKKSLSNGLLVARKQLAPELLKVPVPAAQQGNQ